VLQLTTTLKISESITSIVYHHNPHDRHSVYTTYILHTTHQNYAFNITVGYKSIHIEQIDQQNYHMTEHIFTHCNEHRLYTHMYGWAHIHTHVRTVLLEIDLISSL
jgi:methylthioribose-1-phosphate isomerase